MKRVLIASRWYKPKKNPRAFRTYELVSELVRRKYGITAFLPSDAQVQALINHVPVPNGEMNNELSDSLSNRKSVILLVRNAIRKIFLYLFGDGPKTILYSYMLYKKLRTSLKKNNNYDVIISISYPFYVNVAIACVKSFIRPSTIIIADCGDPFYSNPSFEKAFYLKYLEKWVLKQFDYVTIPIDDACSNYLEYLPRDRIKVIPQGFKLMDISSKIYRKNTVPIFGYAGVFYESIRNPQFFFDYLLTIGNDFRFVVYAISDVFTENILNKYKRKLGDRLVVKNAVEREVLIQEMAKWEFVINFDNDNSNQRPSKLIDYAMSKRPILSFNKNTFSKDKFLAFLHGDYSGGVDIDLSQYDIKVVVDKFENLFCKDRIKESDC